MVYQSTCRNHISIFDVCAMHLLDLLNFTVLTSNEIQYVCFKCKSTSKDIPNHLEERGVAVSQVHALENLKIGF